MKTSMIDLKELNKRDPLHRQGEKQTEVEEMSPMDPPSAYSPPASIEEIPYEELPKLIQGLMDEHKECLKELEAFEEALLGLKSGNFEFTEEIHKQFSHFFRFFDEVIVPHNKKEEKTFFPLLHKKLLEIGEHSQSSNTTPVDVLEDDHTKFLQLGTIAFNFFGLATRLTDPRSQILVLDAAVEQSKELVEELKLHIFREDHVVFQLAAQNLSAEDFAEIEKDYTASTQEGFQV